MAFPILSNTPLRCTMGIAPTPITVLPSMITSLNMDIAKLTDSAPMINIKPFGMCQNPANPVVAAIIASSFGTVRQGPCIPLPTPWLATSMSALSRGLPIVTSNSMKMCYPGGIIKPIPVPVVLQISR